VRLGPKRRNPAVRLSIGFEAFENGLTVVKHRRRWIERDGAVRYELAALPGAARVANRHHVLGEDATKTQAALQDRLTLAHALERFTRFQVEAISRHADFDTISAAIPPPGRDQHRAEASRRRAGELRGKAVEWPRTHG